MGTAIAVRTDFSSQKLRRLAPRVKFVAQAQITEFGGGRW